MLGFLGIGVTVVLLKHAGTHIVDSDRIKMVVKTSASSAAQYLSTRPGTPTGPAAFLGLMLQKHCLLTAQDWGGITRWRVGKGDSLLPLS